MISCIRHPKYIGDSLPTLDCKICCSIYVDVENNLDFSERMDRIRQSLKKVNKLLDEYRKNV